VQHVINMTESTFLFWLAFQIPLESLLLDHRATTENNEDSYDLFVLKVEHFVHVEVKHNGVLDWH
jgi:hypothetical protein